MLGGLRCRRVTTSLRFRFLVSVEPQPAEPIALSAACAKQAKAQHSVADTLRLRRHAPALNSG